MKIIANIDRNNSRDNNSSSSSDKINDYINSGLFAPNLFSSRLEVCLQAHHVFHDVF